MLTDSQEPSSPETSVPTDSDAGSGGPTSLYRDKVLLGTVLGAFVLDQVSKRVITSVLELGESWPSEGFFRITHGTNSGTAFGLFPNQTTLLIVVSLVAIGFLFYFYRAHAMPSLVLRFAIGLQLGGRSAISSTEFSTARSSTSSTLGPGRSSTSRTRQSSSVSSSSWRPSC